MKASNALKIWNAPVSQFASSVRVDAIMPAACDARGKDPASPFALLPSPSRQLVPIFLQFCASSAPVNTNNEIHKCSQESLTSRCSTLPGGEGACHAHTVRGLIHINAELNMSTA